MICHQHIQSGLSDDINLPFGLKMRQRVCQGHVYMEAFASEIWANIPVTALMDVWGSIVN